MSECWQREPCGIDGCRRDHSYLLHFITSRRTPRGTSSHEMGVRTSSDSQGIKRFGDWRTKTQDNKRQRMNVNPVQTSTHQYVRNRLRNASKINVEVKGEGNGEGERRIIMVAKEQGHHEWTDKHEARSDNHEEQANTVDP